ncbi:alpha-ribazole-5'-phosphate phosphatase [Geminocystis sp. NIES-3708]|uniref:histidine phosphatase family protein n=1 Tax=Geminocystis sp. NIES-3708 TaxID=1615909 RepID=UPI0005FC589A|nr:histidine phosphatase family protein [Geminocystis sp. NIES-3708]BAQ63033.1 alpha-ribazole-5'-phosphate phosphatase [Geminocystis sp. NIES-3708]
MSLTIYFLRHGETTSSLSGGYCGILDLDLTPEGYLMAEDFCQAYKNLPWQGIFSSPLSRTIATATPIAKTLGMGIQQRDGLREIAYGNWEGKTPQQVNEEYHDEYVRWLADPGWNAPTGGEKGIDIARRSSQVLEEIENNYSSGNVLIVSHKATIRIMLCSLLGIDLGRYRDRIAMGVSSVTVVKFTERGPLLQILGDRSHLRPELRARHGT